MVWISFAIISFIVLYFFAPRLCNITIVRCNKSTFSHLFTIIVASKKAQCHCSTTSPEQANTQCQCSCNSPVTEDTL